MDTYVCHNCQAVMRGKRNVFRVRLEYVRGDIMERPHVMTARLLCASCVEEEWAAEAPPLIPTSAWRERRGKPPAWAEQALFDE